MFISVLVHELGHVLMGRRFGNHGNILLYGFGGLAINSTSHRDARWQRVAVFFAGPFAGFMFLGVIMAALFATDPNRFWLCLAVMMQMIGLPTDWMPLVPIESNPMLDNTLQALIFINMIWGLVNLLPIWPLDGGQICREGCQWFFPGRGLRISLGVSFVVAGIIAVHCLMAHYGQPLLPFLPIGSMFSAIFFGIFALQSFQLLQQLHQISGGRGDDWNERDPSIWR